MRDDLPQPRRRRNPNPKPIKRKPRPCVRMRELLVIARQQGVEDFDEAWNASWLVMRREKSWPHATLERHAWQTVLDETRAEFRACWYGEVTPFARVARMVLAMIEEEDIKGDEGVVIALPLG